MKVVTHLQKIKTSLIFVIIFSFISKSHAIYYTKIHLTSDSERNISKSICVILEEEIIKKSHNNLDPGLNANNSIEYFEEIKQPATHSIETNDFPRWKLPKKSSSVIEIYSGNQTALNTRVNTLCDFKASSPVGGVTIQEEENFVIFSDGKQSSSGPRYPQVVKIIDNGPSSNRIDVVFMGDGYTLNEKDKFFSDVNRLTEGTFKSDTFNSVRPLINVWAIFVPSKDSGIGYNGIPKNTPFRLYRNKGPLRSIFTKNAKYARQICRLTGPSGCDYPSLIANDDFYGGLGGEFAISTRSPRSGLSVLRHEFGHNFAKVGEEYDSGEIYSGSNSANTLRTLKWAHWLSNSTTGGGISGRRREERMIYRILAYPQNDLEKRPSTFNFWSDGSYSRWYLFTTVSGAGDEDSVEFTLDRKPLSWKPVGTDDKVFFEWEGDTGLARGRHVFTIRSKKKRADGGIKSNKIARMVGSVSMYEYGNEDEFHKDNNFISAYPTWDSRGRKRYRPTNAGCLMRNMTQTLLCSVCMESVWLQFLRKVSLIDELQIGKEFNADGLTKPVSLRVVQLGQFRKVGVKVKDEWVNVKWIKDGQEQKEMEGKLDILASKGRWSVSVTFKSPEIRIPSSKELLTVQRNFTI